MHTAGTKPFIVAVHGDLQEKKSWLLMYISPVKWNKVDNRYWHKWVIKIV